jgi:hypothetical protein
VGLTAAALLSLLVGGCGFATNATPGATSVPPTPPPASSPSGQPASGSPDTPEPSVDSHGVPDLEALLPTRVGDVDLERVSLTGPDFYATGSATNRSGLDTLLGRLGKTVADLAVAEAGDPTGKAVLSVAIFRVRGADPSKLLAEWVTAQEAAGAGRISHASVTVDGRALTKVVDSSRPVGGSTLVYVKGDSLFLVSADDQALVSSALAQLPTP